MCYQFSIIMFIMKIQLVMVHIHFQLTIFFHYRMKLLTKIASLPLLLICILKKNLMSKFVCIAEPTDLT